MNINVNSSSSGKVRERWDVKLRQAGWALGPLAAVLAPDRPPLKQLGQGMDREMRQDKQVPAAASEGLGAAHTPPAKGWADHPGPAVA